jgi:hypothetical protein
MISKKCDSTAAESAVVFFRKCTTDVVKWHNGEFIVCKLEITFEKLLRFYRALITKWIAYLEVWARIIKKEPIRMLKKLSVSYWISEPNGYSNRISLSPEGCEDRKLEAKRNFKKLGIFVSFIVVLFCLIIGSRASYTPIPQRQS